MAQAEEPSEPAAPLTVVAARFAGPDGPGMYFAEGQDIDIVLELAAAGDTRVTGIRGTATFERGVVLDADAVWPDAEPGLVVANADDPMTIRWGDPLPEPVEGGPILPPSCWLAFDGFDGEEEDLVDEVEGEEIVATDPADDPSDPFERIPPGALRIAIETDQGSLEHVIPVTFVCAMFRTGAGGAWDNVPVPAPRVAHADVLATTGAENGPVAGLGGLLIALGLLCRRRASLSSR